MDVKELREIAERLAEQEQMTELMKLRLIECYPEKDRNLRADRIFLQFFPLLLPTEEISEVTVPRKFRGIGGLG